MAEDIAEGNPKAPVGEQTKSPEELRNGIGTDLVRLADIQLRILTAKDNLGNMYNAYERYLGGMTGESQKETSREFEARMKQEASDAAMKELAVSLVDRMEAAREQLGDFCVVVSERDQKGVVLLSPLEKTISQKVYYNKDHRRWMAANEAEEDILYTKREKVQEVFFVNRYGLQKMVLPTERGYSLAENSRHTKTAWFQQWSDHIKGTFDRYTADAGSAFFAVLNGKTDTGRGVDADQKVSSIRAQIAGILYLSDSDKLLSDLYVDADREYPGGGIRSLITIDQGVKDAFEDSVGQAQQKTEVASSRPEIRLFVGQNRS